MEPKPLGRRGFFKKTAGGALLLGAAAAVPLALRESRLRPDTPKDLHFFTAAEYAIFAAIAERVLARELPTATGQPMQVATLGAGAQGLRGHNPAADAPPSPASVEVARKADGFFALLGPADGREVKQLLGLFDNALFSLLFGDGPTPFTQKSPAEQDAQLDAWARSRLAVRRTGYQALRRLSGALYFGSPETYASVGYPGPPVELVRSFWAGRGEETP